MSPSTQFPARSTDHAATGKTKRGWEFSLPKIQFGKPVEESKWNPVTTYYLILIPAILLGVFGLLMGFSATSVTNIAQGVNPYVPFARTAGIAVAALVIAAVAAFLSPGFWNRSAVYIFSGALVLQLMLIPFGVGQGGNVNWLPVPGLAGQAIQPSEFLKLATALILARVLSMTFVRADNWKHVLLGVGIPSMLAIGSVMYGADMGTALIFVALVLGALWVAGVPARWFATVGLGMAAAATFLVSISPSRTRRVIEFLPGYGSAPSTSAPTQTDHGLWALGSGGLTGLGPGASRAKWDYLQEAHTDFILAIIGEEFGLLGTLTLLAVFGALVYGVLQLAANARSAFVRIASGGIAAWFIAQALINVGTVTGLVPVIGVPFPLVSYGGSSFLFTAMAIGILLSFARTEAGMTRASRLNAETGGRDPRKRRRRRGRSSGRPVPKPGARQIATGQSEARKPRWEPVANSRVAVPKPRKRIAPKKSQEAS